MGIGTQSYGDRGGSASAQAKEKATELTRTARDRAMSTLDERKGQLSGLLDRMADTMQDDAIGSYASEYVRRGAETLRRRSADDLLRQARRSVRSRPGVLLGACFVAGLAFARLLKGVGDGEWREGARDGGSEAGRWGGRGYGEDGHREGSWARTGVGEPALREGQP